MAQNKILVIGSANTDMVVQSPHLPKPGETILGGEFLMNPGGKGANQAVAASRLGGDISFIAKIGDDMFGKNYIDILQKEGLNTNSIINDPDKPSGIALINVDKKGENSIVVAPGSNNNLLNADIDRYNALIDEAGIILLQLEIPLETVIYIAEKATAKGKKVILNPAPAQQLPEKLLSSLYLITPNESEASLLTGINVHDNESAKQAGIALREKGVNIVIMTMGNKGAYILSEQHNGIVPGLKVDATDTTAAGDVFNGALTVALSEDKNLEEAVNFANKAASISVTRMGAQQSAPFRKEL